MLSEAKHLLVFFMIWGFWKKVLRFAQYDGIQTDPLPPIAFSRRLRYRVADGNRLVDSQMPAGLLPAFKQWTCPKP